jgi:hypothetical protein
MLEHRCSKRLDTCIDAVLIPKQDTPVIGKIRNIGRDGLFFETTRSLPRNFIVKISFRLAVASNNVICSRAMIIHSTPQGIGLLADQTIAEAFNALQQQPNMSAAMPSLLAG